MRPHPRLGTVELRELDAQTTLDDVAALAALAQAVARAAVENHAPAREPQADAIAWSSFRAIRDGIDAEILHEGAIVPVREAARDFVGRAPAGDAALEGVERILREGNAATRQRADYARGAMSGVLTGLVERTREG